MDSYDDIKHPDWNDELKCFRLPFFIIRGLTTEEVKEVKESLRNL
jgi:hypothetical protein